ncbi:MAG TPA: IS1595 family transposase [Candidatus Limnocylindrales bacterium]|nr:IS1595 family transposase [Candidatus Limnocylindrales bacterium]
MQFGSEDKCRTYLEQLRWPEGVRCTRCGSDKISRIKARAQFDCDSCRYQFSVTAGTIFHDSHLPLWKWFLAVYVMGESKKGISANQMKRMLGVSYKTAWYLCHRIRAAMIEVDPEPLTGIIEADETYHGNPPMRFGRRIPGRGGVGYGSNKTAIIGAVERGGRVRLKVSDRVNRKALHEFLKSVMADEAEAIYTDDYQPYIGIADPNTRHETVNHGRKEWVQGDVHTQTMEDVWSLFKRSVIGSYHHLSVKHLQAYLDELAFRYNNRENAYLFRDTLLTMVGADSMKYAELIAV